jgi:hypothetical protein
MRYAGHENRYHCSCRGTRVLSLHLGLLRQGSLRTKRNFSVSSLVTAYHQFASCETRHSVPLARQVCRLKSLVTSRLSYHFYLSLFQVHIVQCSHYSKHPTLTLLSRIPAVLLHLRKICFRHSLGRWQYPRNCKCSRIWWVLPVTG